MSKLLIEVEEGLSGTVHLRRGAAGSIVCDDRGAKPDLEQRAGRADRPPRTTPAAAPAAAPAARVEAKKSDARKAEAKAEVKAETKATPKAETKATPKVETPAKGATKPKKDKKPKSLAWQPTTDAGYKGFAAKTHNGAKFKLLHAKGSQWALLRERPDGEPETLGCFVKEELGRAAAQKLHDTQPKPRKITEVTVVELCPMPGGEGGDDDDDGEVPTPPTPAASGPSSETPSDAAMFESLKNVLKELDADE